MMASKKYIKETREARLGCDLSEVTEKMGGGEGGRVGGVEEWLGSTEGKDER